MLILLTFQHFYMTKSEALTSDFVDSLKLAAIPQAFFFLRQLVAFCRMDPMGGLC